MKINFLQQLTKRKEHLFKIKSDESLNFFSILILIFLDIFILINVFDGLENQSKVLTRPNEYIPYICRDIIIDSNWIENNKIDKLSKVILSQKRNYYYSNPYKIKKAHIECKPILEVLKNIQDDKKILSTLTKRDKLNKSYSNLDEYQKRLENQGKKILLEIKTLDSEINNNRTVIKFWKLLKKQERISEILVKDLRYINYIFPLKKLLVEFIFLVPLMIFFGLWNIISLKKGKNIQGLLSTHLSIVVFIPVFIKLCETIFHIIPDKLITSFIEYLQSIKLIGLWNYILTIIASAFALLLIYISQKKVFNKEKTMIRRFYKNRCVICGTQLKENEDHCFECGSSQKRECPHCKRLTYKMSKYCIHCGEKINENQNNKGAENE